MEYFIHVPCGCMRLSFVSSRPASSTSTRMRPMTTLNSFSHCSCAAFFSFGTVARAVVMPSSPPEHVLSVQPRRLAPALSSALSLPQRLRFWQRTIEGFCKPVEWSTPIGQQVGEWKSTAGDPSGVDAVLQQPQLWHQRENQTEKENL